jgi:hypothetical protein
MPNDTLVTVRGAAASSMDAVAPGRRPTGGALEVTAAALLFGVYYVAYFAPALLGDRLLAPGDGLIYYVPALLSKAAAWNHLLYAGHPGAADAQALFFNPLRWIGNYNAAVIAVYILASTSTYCLVRYLTGMRLAGVFAGLVYGSGGAMIAHLGHLTIIYSAAWIPLIAWAVARARDDDFPAAVAIGALAVACPMLGGHPQIFVYGLVLTGLYALHSLLDPAVCGRRALLVRYALVFGVGLAIASVQLIPLAELGSWSVRERMTFDEFTSYSLDPKGLLLFLFPSILGGARRAVMPYFGTWNVTELATYAGISTLLLGLVALSARRREREAKFWATAALVGVVYALGRYTPLGEIAFHTPGLNQFRAPARTAFLTTMSLAVLAGFGWRAIAQHRIAGVRLRRARIRAAVLLGVPVLVLLSLYPWLTMLAKSRGITLPPRFHNPALWTAVAAMIASAAVVGWYVRRPLAAPAIAILVVLVFDLAAFGWFYEWQDGARTSAIALDDQWRDFAGEVRNARERALFIDGMKSANAPARPNLNLLYGLPSATGYGPLLLKGYADVMGVDPTGAIASTDHLKERLQLAGAGWVLGGDTPDRPIRLGGDCTVTPGLTESALAMPVMLQVTAVEVVSQLFCSVAVAQDTPVMTMQFASGGSTVDIPFRAGRDTAEWAIARSDVAPSIKHRSPPDYETYSAGNFDGRWFRTRIPLQPDGAPVAVDRLRLKWDLAPAPGIVIRSIELIDASGARHRLSTDHMLRAELAPVAERKLPGVPWVLRPARTGAAAWLVDEVVPMSDTQALATIRSGRLPDGRAFDPYRTALTDATAAPAAAASKRNDARVSVEEVSDGLLRMAVQAPGPTFLVVAESFYPGWTATLDGRPAAIVRTNVAFQGVRVPEGKHAVVFSFRSRSLSVGIATALAGLAVLVAYFFVVARARRRSVLRADARLADAR